MHGLPDRPMAAERKGEIRDTPTDASAREILLDQRNDINEVLGVVVVLLCLFFVVFFLFISLVVLLGENTRKEIFTETSANCEDVGVKNDVVGVKADLFADQDVVGALADGELGLRVRSLSHFVKLGQEKNK